MYVNEKTRPLTFEDLTRAVRRSAGLGQDLSNYYIDVTNPSSVPLSNLPLASGSETNPASSNYNPYDVALNAVAATAPTPMPWGTLALVAAGLILFGLVVGNPN